MSTTRSLLRACLVATLLAAGTADAADTKSVLVYSGSTGYRHQSIPAGVEAIKTLAVREGFAVETSEDPNVFSPERLKPYAVIVFLSSTTEPKNPATEWLVGERRAALQGFVSGGKGIVAIHAAADSHYHWPWYVRMIGGSFERHPKGTPAGVLTVIDGAHPATHSLPKSIPHVDEWYYYKDLDPRVRVLLTVDPGSIGESDANPNPIAWAHEFEGGRVFYTGLGHTAETFKAEFFQKHIVGALRWAAGDAR